MHSNNIYQSKLFSILGDSISTLGGYSEPEDAAFYAGMKKFEADVFLPEDTWWGQVIHALGGRLLVNQSISGSMVVKHPRCQIPSYGCSPERTAALGRDGQSPDVILVYLGTNDWGAGVQPTPVLSSEQGSTAVFSVAYRRMLEQLRANYPQAEIWCFTLAVSTCSKEENFIFPYYYAGRHIEKYCEVIRACAEDFGCRVIDLYGTAEPYDTIDEFHPNAAGMQTLARAVLAQLED